MTSLPDKVEPRGMSEVQITKAVMTHWRSAGRPGTKVASIPNMGARGQYGLTKGLPDLMVMGPGLPVGFIELKTDKGRVKPEQVAFGDLCAELGIPHAITRGRDEPIRLLEAWGIVRAGR